MATAIDTSFSEKEGSNSTRTNLDKIRNAEDDGLVQWEHLEEVKIPGKTWDNVVSHTSTSRNDDEPNPSDEQTTMSR